MGHAQHDGPSSPAVRGIAEEACGRWQKRTEEAIEPEGTGGPGNDGDVAHTDSAGLQAERTEEQTAGAPGEGNDVQHSDGTGCKEQYVPRKPEGQGFPYRRCNEGNVCNATGQGLPDRTGGKMGRQGTSEQEPERPDSHVSHSDDRKDGRGNRRPAEIEKAGGRWSDNGSGEEGHEPEQWLSAQSRLGGMADGVPGGLDGYWDIEPDIPRITEGAAHRCDRIKALGNAVVPQQFYPIFEAIAKICNNGA